MKCLFLMFLFCLSFVNMVTAQGRVVYLSDLMLEKARQVENEVLSVNDVLALWPNEGERCINHLIKLMVASSKKKTPEKDDETFALFQYLVRLPISEKDDNRAELIEHKSDAVRQCCLSIPILRKNRLVWVEFARFLGDMRSLIIPNYVPQGGAFSGLSSPEEMEVTLKELERLRQVDAFQHALRRKESLLVMTFQSLFYEFFMDDYPPNETMTWVRKMASIAGLEEDEWFPDAVEACGNAMSQKSPQVLEKASEGWSQMPRADGPGFGYPGNIEVGKSGSGFQNQLNRFSLVSLSFTYGPMDVDKYEFNSSESPKTLPFLLYRPKEIRQGQAVPMLVYFSAGSHETTEKLLAANTLFFSIVTDPAFQSRYPCYVLAPAITDEHAIFPLANQFPLSITAMVCDAMYAVIRDATPPVDTARLYTTGFSAGASGSYALMSAYPGRFAACLPVSGFQGKAFIPEETPGRYWAFNNEEELRRGSSDKQLRELKALVESRGGEFRIGTYPDKGHNAWSKAWREDAVWRWMFSQTTGAPVKTAVANTPAEAAAVLMPDARRCTASQPGRDAGSGPERGGDGLDGTAYVSVKPVQKGDWFSL